MKNRNAGFAVLPIIIVLTFLIIAGGGVYYLLVMNGDIKETLSGSSLYTQENFNKKKELINTNNIDSVITAIKIGHVPNSVSTDERAFSSINIKAFQIDLSINDRYEKVNKYLNISEYPNPDSATLTNSIWKGFSYSEASDMYTKDGYSCIILRPNRFKSTPYMSCSSALDLSQNTLTNVSGFMLKTLSEAGVDCKSEKCEIIETQEEYPLNKYGRKLVYFDKGVSGTNDDELVEEANNEAEGSAKFLESSGWKVNLEQYTETERKWNKSALVSILIKAENSLFSCSHNITVMGLGKRQIIGCVYKNSVLEEVQKFYNPYK